MSSRATFFAGSAMLHIYHTAFAPSTFSE